MQAAETPRPLDQVPRHLVPRLAQGLSALALALGLGLFELGLAEVIPEQSASILRPVRSVVWHLMQRRALELSAMALVLGAVEPAQEEVISALPAWILWSVHSVLRRLMWQQALGLVRAQPTVVVAQRPFVPGRAELTQAQPT